LNETKNGANWLFISLAEIDYSCSEKK